MSVYLIVTLWSYPFGGGEAFLFQTMKWAYDIGMKCYWISFSSVNPSSDYKQLAITTTKYGTIIHIPGGFNQDSLFNWTKLLNPTIVHTQGNKKREILDTISKLRVPILTGYHFWNGLIDLYPTTSNKSIVTSISKHKKSNELDEVLNNKYAVPYVCSDFMKEVVQKVCKVDIPVMYASSSKNDTFIKSNNVLKNKFVTLVNIHKLKGGEVFYELVRRLFDLPFIGIKTEPNSEDLDRKITDLMKQKRDGSLIIEHTTNIKNIYKSTRILIVPSLVDETFCRVVNEGLMNGIPIVTTGAGNIKYLVGDAAIIIPPENIEAPVSRFTRPRSSCDTSVSPNFLNDWISTVADLYYDEQKLYDLSIKSKKQYKLFSEKVAVSQFKMMIDSTIRSNKDNNVMLFIPFCDQGLGIQGRNYLNLLKDRFGVFIFSYRPYNSGTTIELQKDTDEWKYDKVYYSNNIREKVTDEEIVSFVTSNNIGKCVIPETCWFRVFEVATLLKRLSVKTYAIPNIEIVRKDEIYKHHVFDKILCNNKLCEDSFRSFGFGNVESIGYAIEQKEREVKINNKFTFLCIGGMNAFSRKQVVEVCEAFVKAYDYVNEGKVSCKYNIENIRLIVTIQKFYNNDKLSKFIKHPAIEVINQHLSYKEINKLYSEADVFIQVSKKEGLGLGFFESLSCGTPILTLNTAPHNEIVHDGINGWICICKHEKMKDNPEALLDDAIVNIELLSEKMIDILKCDISSINKTTVQDYKQRFSIKTFKQKLIKSLS